MKKPTYAELTEALDKALEHLDYCGWGDSYERECAEQLRKELPKVLKGALAHLGRKALAATNK